MRPFFEETVLHDASEAIARAIELIGGPTAVAVRLGTSPQTVHHFRKMKRVQNAVFAHLLADLVAEAAQAESDHAITSRVLSGMDPWDLTTRATTDRTSRKRRRLSAPAQNRTGTYVPPAVAAPAAIAETAAPNFGEQRKAA